MRNLYLDPTTHDITTNTAKNLRFTEDQGEFVSQKIENKLKTFFGEWFLDNEIGVPYFERILKKAPDLNDVNNLLLIEVATINEVEEVLEFDTDYDNAEREYTVNYKVRITGETDPLEGSVTL